MMATWLKPNSEKTSDRMKEYICKEVPTEDGGYLEIETELIRCEDCVWRDKKTANCERFRKGWYVQALSYCSWAERKEE